MLIIPPPKYPRKSGRIIEQAMVPPPLLPLAILNVSGASFHAGSGSVTVSFDINSGYELVDPGSANPAQWYVGFNHVLYRGVGFEFNGGSSLTISFTQYGGALGANWISYSADPSDISDTQGRMLGEVDEQPF